MTAAIDPRWSTQLEQGLVQLGIGLTTGQQRTLLDYLALLAKWNRRFNLTAVRDPAEMVSRQLLDSLSILPLLQGQRLLDVGSGPGLPGLPLAVANPDQQWTLLDSNGKKTRFVEQARMALGVSNLSVVQQRVEAYRPAQRFDTVTSRAFASLEAFAECGLPLLADRGILLAMKGRLQPAELVPLADLGLRVEARPLRVPGETGARHAILCRRP